MNTSVLQKVVTFFGFSQAAENGRPGTAEGWERKLDRRAARYGLSGATEVLELRSQIPELIAKGESEQIAYILSQIDPNLRVLPINTKGTLWHYESGYVVPVLSPTTVFDYHLPRLRGDLTRIVVDDRLIVLYAGKKKLAAYFSLHTIPLLMTTRRTVQAVQLIEDYTGLKLNVEQLMRMRNVSFERRGQCWFIKIP